MLSGLKTLKLMYLGLLGPSVDQVIDVLLASLALVNLALICLFKGGYDVVSSNGRNVDLSYLQSLSFDHLLIDAIHRLLHTMHIPNCTKLYLYVPVDTDNSGLQVATTRKIAPVVQKILFAEGSDPWIEIIPCSILLLDKIRGRNNKMEVDTRLAGDPTLALVESIVGTFQPLKVGKFVRVTISVYSDHTPRSMVILIL
ncbi:hypothetical protein FRB94_002777 [Tulasnella sp. JGI-2019a]|nr:hypothetical protein FRB94_002777 [Tulasnella sp. JGI-2019a]KAG9012399.1 hypothetical protein FRB93_001822 [Tulasnella sp. JGI-2019a]KAG9031416.1 hypothetical protein FRB95_002780 [Tulasnella sp. JGI-2019a]